MPLLRHLAGREAGSVLVLWGAVVMKGEDGNVVGSVEIFQHFSNIQGFAPDRVSDLGRGRGRFR